MKTHSRHITRIAVAVSGGADSLYTLISLQQMGFDVIALHGVFSAPLNLYDTEENSRVQHESQNTQANLKAACQTLNIPLHIADCSHNFMQAVIRPFVESYAKGHTPNPCALCNAAIKFGMLQELAKNLGADLLATGHYARLIHAYDSAINVSEQLATNCISKLQVSKAVHTEQVPALLQGADATKDQSYFLALVPPAQLASSIFPLGNIHKTTVIQTLNNHGIAIPQPKESQEVCFIPQNEYRDFLPNVARTLGISLPGAGNMVLESGKTIGTHKGLWQYTEGQRRGLGIGYAEPLHVLYKDQTANALVLGPRSAMRVTGCECDHINVLLPFSEWPPVVYAKTRYRERPKPAHVSISSQTGTMDITFAEPDTAVAPGQIAAIYIPLPECTESDGRPLLRLVAGGIITRAKHHSGI